MKEFTVVELIHSIRTDDERPNIPSYNNVNLVNRSHIKPDDVNVRKLDSILN